MTINDLILDDWEIVSQEGNRLILTRDGYRAYCATASGSMMLHDPAGVAVCPPETYSMEALDRARWRCWECGRTADELPVLAFVRDRCCDCIRGTV